MSREIESERIEMLAPGIRALKVSMPGGHIPYSLCYLIEDSRGDVHLVDPGWPSDENWKSLERALEASGHRIDDVASVVPSAPLRSSTIWSLLRKFGAGG